jgi:hypothetical protein
VELLTSIVLGICLSAACGFRVFVPLFVMSIAAFGGYFTPNESMSWVASVPALILFGTATVMEIAAYYIPWADNLLDTIATPAALIAGAVASFSVLGDVSPTLQWILAIVAGSGSAGIVQAGTVLLRGTSSVTTGGLGNPVVATVENGLSLLTSVLALVVPVIALVLVVAIVSYTWRLIGKFRRKRGEGHGRS